MKSVLISTKPKWCELIVNGKKTVEVRKTTPKLKTPFKVYIYCTKGNLALLRDDSDTEKYKYDVWKYAEFHQSCGKKILGGKVIGEFVCDKITTAEYGNYVTTFSENAQLTAYDLMSYARGNTLYGWHISNLIIYDKPRDLGEFYRECEEPNCDDCPNLCVENTPDYYEIYCICDEKIPIKRPPQSWCYVGSEGEK